MRVIGHPVRETSLTDLGVGMENWASKTIQRSEKSGTKVLKVFRSVLISVLSSLHLDYSLLRPVIYTVCYTLVFLFQLQVCKAKALEFLAEFLERIEKKVLPYAVDIKVKFTVISSFP